MVEYYWLDQLTPLPKDHILAFGIWHLAFGIYFSIGSDLSSRLGLSSSMSGGPESVNFALLKTNVTRKECNAAKLACCVRMYFGVLGTAVPTPKPIPFE